MSIGRTGANPTVGNGGVETRMRTGPEGFAAGVEAWGLEALGVADCAASTTVAASATPAIPSKTVTCFPSFMEITLPVASIRSPVARNAANAAGG